jgi:hypothetical protein
MDLHPGLVSRFRHRVEEAIPRRELILVFSLATISEASIPFPSRRIYLEAQVQLPVCRIVRMRMKRAPAHFIQPLREAISREVGYRLSLEGSSAANLLKSLQAATKRVAPKAEVA